MSTTQTTAREAAILEVRQRNASGLSKSYHAKHVVYLSEIPQSCPNDGEQLDLVKKVLLERGDVSIKTKAWCCFRCRTAYLLETDQEKISQKFTHATQKIQAKSKQHTNDPTTSTNTDPTNFAIPQNILYVCKGLISCKKNNHTVEAVTGILFGKNREVIKLNTNYCPHCKKCFISYNEYMNYRRRYGALLGNIKIANGSFITSETELAEESILHICGYSVNQSDNLSITERHAILQYLIDSKVSSKPEIISYLDFFIRRNGKKQNMEEAVRRWTEDINWVRDYQINRQHHYEIASIQKNR